MNYYNYFTDIEEAFVRRRGKHLMISPKDWALIGAWEERGIPLHIVLRAIDTVFDAVDKQNMSHTISSLAYCKNEVEAQFLAHNVGQVGKSPEEPGAASATGGRPSTFTVETVQAHIDTAIEKLNQAAAPQTAVTNAVAKLQDLRGRVTTDFEAVEAVLNDIEKELEAAILTSATAPAFTALEKQVTAQLAAYKAEMDPDAYQNTFTLMFLKRLREESGIPRLSLFYL